MWFVNIVNTCFHSNVLKVRLVVWCDRFCFYIDLQLTLMTLDKLKPREAYFHNSCRCKSTVYMDQSNTIVLMSDLLQWKYTNIYKYRYPNKFTCINHYSRGGGGMECNYWTLKSFLREGQSPGCWPVTIRTGNIYRKINIYCFLEQMF